MSKQSFGTLFGDILTEWLLRHVEDVFFMSNFENPFKDFVFSLPEDKLDLLIECINNRKDYDLYGVTAYDGKMVRV